MGAPDSIAGLDGRGLSTLGKERADSSAKAMAAIAGVLSRIHERVVYAPLLRLH